MGVRFASFFRLLSILGHSDFCFFKATVQAVDVCVPCGFPYCGLGDGEQPPHFVAQRSQGGLQPDLVINGHDQHFAKPAWGASASAIMRLGTLGK